jgi:hypothetical protein
VPPLPAVEPAVPEVPPLERVPPVFGGSVKSSFLSGELQARNEGEKTPVKKDDDPIFSGLEGLLEYPAKASNSGRNRVCFAGLETGFSGEELTGSPVGDSQVRVFVL